MIIDQAVELLIYGMSIVFLFLGLLVFSLTLMSYIVSHLEREKNVVQEESNRDSIRSEFESLSPKTITIIEAALRLHLQG